MKAVVYNGPRDVAVMDVDDARIERPSDAMLLSQWLGMPTIAGNSSWYPAGYDFVRTDQPDYPGKALAWIAGHGLRDHVCGVDPRTRQWQPGVAPLLREGQP